MALSMKIWNTGTPLSRLGADWAAFDDWRFCDDWRSAVAVEAEGDMPWLDVVPTGKPGDAAFALFCYRDIRAGVAVRLLGFYPSEAVALLAAEMTAALASAAPERRIPPRMPSLDLEAGGE